MPQQGLRLEDIIRSQERMAAQGDKTAAATIQRLQEMERTLKADHELSKQDRLLQAVQVYEAVKADKDDDRIADATEKTAEEVEKVNNNVAKLAQAIKGAVAGEVVAAPEGMQGVTAEKVAQVTREVDTARTKGFGQQIGEGFKSLGSLKGWFDVSGSSRGMLDDIIRRRIEKMEFIKTQQEVGGATKEVALQRYKETDKLKKQAENIKSQIEVYKSQGLSEQQIEGSDAYKRLQSVQAKIVEADPLVQERLLEKQVDRETQSRERIEKTFAAAAGVTPATFQAPLIATREAKDNLLGGAEEQQMEQFRMWQEELNLLAKIEENTRGLKQAQQPKQITQAVPQPSMLDDLTLGSILKKVAGFVFSTAGIQLLVGAGLLLAIRQLAQDYKEGRERSLTYQQLRAEKKAGTITPEGEVRLAELERQKQTGEKPVFSGKIAEERGRAIKSQIDKQTAEDILKNIESPDPEERGRAQETLKEFGVTKEVLQRYYERVYGPQATPQTRAGATLGAIAVELGETQKIVPIQQEITRGEEAIAPLPMEDPSTIPVPLAEVPTPSSPIEMARMSRAERYRIRREQNNRARLVTQEEAQVTTPTPQGGELVYLQSEANAAAAATPPAAPAAPVVINAPTSVQQTSNYGPKSPPRNTESSYQQYNRARYSF